MTSKICTKCKKEKSLDQFRKDLRYKIGHTSWCITCIQELQDKHKTIRQNMSPAKKREFYKQRYSLNRDRELAYRRTDKALFNAYKSDTKRRRLGMTFELTFQEFQTLINNSCMYCGQPNCRGIDRIENDVGYTANNSVSCCWTCNHMKYNRSQQDFLTHIKKMYLHLFKGIKHEISNY
jgi:hypothetical protein